ncbi:MBL fold metallo-hydrolase [Bradyrhizobium erythrophlei]|uniref:MBL fold metallo-hydrolase n=1 Tax=Bradyrhizobium erythrophlei TaxID=1437360 RepID=UPI000B8065A4|nr:MBL fold metallo-hydrolase [Bradyrhizobium erythrophlei]
MGRNKELGAADVFGDAFFDSVVPIVDAGLATMFKPPIEIGGCLTAEPAPGHSPGQVTYRLRSRGEEAVFSGDVLHSPIQIVMPALNTSYCVWPDIARQTRRAFLERAADQESLILPVHFGAPHCGYIRRQADGFRFEPAKW